MLFSKGGLKGEALQEKLLPSLLFKERETRGGEVK
jgi:hypothetical protein